MKYEFEKKPLDKGIFSREFNVRFVDVTKKDAKQFKGWPFVVDLN
jgi:hypothetical protein